VIDILMSHVIPFFIASGMKKGSRQYVRLAADPALANVSGAYFVKGEPKDTSGSPLTDDAAIQSQIDEAAEAWAAPYLASRQR
jgi:hypothetical protein